MSSMIDLPRKTYFNTPFKYRDQVRDAEDDARALIRLAVDQGEVEYPWVPFGDDGAWWDSVFDTTELELIEQLNAIAAEYKRTPIYKRKGRKLLMIEYIKVDARLTVGHGLETAWYM